ncbi:MAG TPA: dephospho-CoA kinase [Usitatibacter sp.]|jgi:dephospho-CoA kinase|nr:dephospho-CoA kinase [Usitatibacter sp.]
MTFVVGLTGGIGSGKTTVATMLAALGATVVDTDAIAHALTGAGGAAMEAIRGAFGDGVVGRGGALDRTAMRRLAFADAGARARLEAILHPMIRAATDAGIAAATGVYALAVVPLLFETGAYARRASRVLVVDCAPEVQVERTKRRSALSTQEVLAIMDAQWPRWRRLQMADDVAWNGAGPEELAAQCDRLHQKYRQLAAASQRNLSM